MFISALREAMSKRYIVFIFSFLDHKSKSPALKLSAGGLLKAAYVAAELRSDQQLLHSREPPLRLSDAPLVRQGLQLVLD